MDVLVAGAGGAVGRRLIPQLVAKGHRVVATTRTPAKLDGLRRLGAEPAMLDGLDGAAVGELVARTAPDVVVHQMSALAGIGGLRRFDRGFAVTNRLRTEGTDHLLAASTAAGVRRFVAQSYTGWPNAREGGPVKSEDDPWDPHPPAAQRKSLAAIRYLERTVLSASSALEPVVLRYGSFYGAGASEEFLDFIRKRRFPVAGDGGGVWSFVHMDDAAAATVLAAESHRTGVYNVVDDEPAPVATWLPYLAAAVGASPPHRMPLWLARLVAGEVAVSMLTQVRGSSNAKAKRELNWQLRWPSWREGFRDWASSASGSPVTVPRGIG